MDKRVRKKGAEFVVELIKQPQTQEAVVILLKNVLVDPKFIYHSTFWATDLFTELILSDSVIKNSKILVERVLRQDAVAQETVNMLKFVTEKEDAKDIIAEYSKIVFKRKDIIDHVSILLAEGAYQGMADTKSIELFAQFLLKVVRTQEVKSGIINTFVYQPLWNFWYTITFRKK
jgi:hypothetical protein